MQPDFLDENVHGHMKQGQFTQKIKVKFVLSSENSKIVKICLCSRAQIDIIVNARNNKNIPERAKFIRFAPKLDYLERTPPG